MKPSQLKLRRRFTCLTLSLLALAVVNAGSVANSPTATNAPSAKDAVKPYPIDRCILCGMKVNGSHAYSFVHQGQEIKLCSKDEREEFERHAEKYLKKIAREAAKQKK
jgi:YHS domain-containing protein